MKVAVVYWSGTGNTERMAEEIAKAAREKQARVDTFFINEFDRSMVDHYDRIAFGCPSMGAEELEPTEFVPVYEELEPELKDKEIAIFGSYEWNNGEWMEDWHQRVLEGGSKLVFEPLAAYDNPDEDALSKCRELGEKLAE